MPWRARIKVCSRTKNINRNTEKKKSKCDKHANFYERGEESRGGEGRQLKCCSMPLKLELVVTFPLARVKPSNAWRRLSRAGLLQVGPSLFSLGVEAHRQTPNTLSPLSNAPGTHHIHRLCHTAVGAELLTRSQQSTAKTNNTLLLSFPENSKKIPAGVCRSTPTNPPLFSLPIPALLTRLSAQGCNASLSLPCLSSNAPSFPVIRSSARLIRDSSDPAPGPVVETIPWRCRGKGQGKTN